MEKRLYLVQADLLLHKHSANGHIPSKSVTRLVWAADACEADTKFRERYEEREAGSGDWLIEVDVVEALPAIE